MKNFKLSSWLFLTASILFASNVAAVDFLTPEQEARGNGFLNKDLYIYETRLVGTPEQKILLAIDTFHADAAPWIHFGEAVDPIMTWRLPKIILDTYDFDLIITGHERMVPTHAHFETYKEMVDDMKRFTYETAASPELQKKAKETQIRYSV